MNIKHFYTILIILAFSKLNAQLTSYAWANSITGNGNIHCKTLTNDISENSILGTTFIGDLVLGNDTVKHISGNSYNDILVSKFRPTGALIWTKTYGGTGDDNISSLITDKNGNIYLAGSFDSDSISFDKITLYRKKDIKFGWNYNFFLLKLDSNGIVNFAKSGNGYHNDFGVGVSIDNQNNVYLTGNFYGDSTNIDGRYIAGTGVDNGEPHIFIFKLKSNGSLIWAKSIIAQNYRENVTSITTDNTGNCYISGDYYNSSNQNDIFIQKLDKDGKLIWRKTFGDTENESTTKMVLDKNNNHLIIVGNYSSKKITFKDTIIYNASAKSDDIFIANLDTNGKVIWVFTTGGTKSDLVFDIMAVNDYFYLTGEFSSSYLKFGESNLGGSTSGGNNLFIVKFNSFGEVIWSKLAGNGSGKSITANLNGNIIVSGEFYSWTRFDDFTFKNENGTGNDVFITKIIENESPSKASEFNIGTIGIHPNPSSEFLLLSNKNNTQIDFNIYSQNGILIKSGFTYEKIDISQLNTGFYILKTNFGNFKFIKE